MPDSPEELTDDQLEAALDQTVLRTPGYPELAEEVVEEAPVEPDAPQEEQEQTPPQEASETETPAESEEPAPAEADDTDLEAEEQKALMAELEARAKKWEQVAGRHAGKLGFLEKRLAAMSQQPPAPAPQMADEAEYGEREAPPPPQRQAPTAPASDPMSTWVIQKAMEAGVAEFRSKYPDSSEMDTELARYLSETGYNTAAMLESNDPVFTQQESRRALEEAYWHVVGEKRAAARAELAERRAVQTAKLKQAKQSAAPSATASAPPPKPRPKTAEQLTDAEIEAELQRATGGQQWYRRPR